MEKRTENLVQNLINQQEAEQYYKSRHIEELSETLQPFFRLSENFDYSQGIQQESFDSLLSVLKNLGLKSLDSNKVIQNILNLQEKIVKTQIQIEELENQQIENKQQVNDLHGLNDYLEQVIQDQEQKIQELQQNQEDTEDIEYNILDVQNSELNRKNKKNEMLLIQAGYTKEIDYSNLIQKSQYLKELIQENENQARDFGGLDFVPQNKIQAHRILNQKKAQFSRLQQQLHGKVFIDANQ